MLLNSKGFNLFTALVSFLLIMLAVLLIQSMIQAERNATDTVDHIESRARLEATAEMARADAMQVFNYALRKRIEDWLVDSARGVVSLRLEDRSWKEIQDDFAESKFGGTEGSQFAHFTASSLAGIFHQPQAFGNYTISIPSEELETLAEGINKAIAKSVKDDFFTVIECDGDPRGDHCPLGTFYVNLHIERLSQEEYENLPKIVVVDKGSGEELKQVILPRTVFRIYVPLRFFKAIAEARALTHYSSGGSFDDPTWINSSSDKGLFSPQVHNDIEKMALGLCDYGSCAPRQDPLVPVTVDPNVPADYRTGLPAKDPAGNALFCPGDSTAPTWSTNGIETKLICNYPWCAGNDVPKNYSANNNNGWEKMQGALGKVAEARVCAVIRDAKLAGFMDSVADDNFVLVGKECGEGGAMLAYDVAVNVDTANSKVIGMGKGQPQSEDPGRNIGLYLDGDEVKAPVISQAEMSCSNDFGDYKAGCAEVNDIEVTLAFEEKDPAYMVRRPEPGSERLYRIKVSDNTYVPFTANWQQGNEVANFLYGIAPQRTNCSMGSGLGWQCVTMGTGGSLGKPMTVGCVPG
ncbi:MAG: hypothetical protein WC634_03655 [archaeon]